MKEGLKVIPGPTGPQGEPGVSITRSLKDETSFYVHLSDGTIKQLSKPEGIVGPKEIQDLKGPPRSSWS